jgi:oxygen-independent coproporphyrinogen-3 oxidase
MTASVLRCKTNSLQLTPMNNFRQSIEWDDGLIRNYDLAGPRYTSYPTAPQFREDFSWVELLRAIARSNSRQRPLSLYFHIPFCDTLCYYCGCHKIVTSNKGRAAPYLQRLIAELKLQAANFDRSRPVKQLHWGGGTPTFISETEMTELMQATRNEFRLLDDDTGDYAIEVHPGQLEVGTISHLRRLGFNRISMGVQDFDERVQKAVNRFNSLAQVRDLVKAVRQQHFHSLSMDLIYGLPLQTPASVAQTLSYIVDLSPERISLFNYAHLPERFRSQRLINAADLPSAATKLEILHSAIEQLQAAGYVYLGMDHFVKPGDSLAKAQASGNLQRNFQGYSTHGDCDLIALGVSAISAIDDVYVQNAKDLKTYQHKLDLGQLPFERGLTLTAEDKLRQFVIGQLICHLRLEYADVEKVFNLNPREHFASELRQLAPMIEDGLLSLHDWGIEVHNRGRLLIRRLCMVFDEYLQQGNPQIRYSKII